MTLRLEGNAIMLRPEDFTYTQDFVDHLDLPEPLPTGNIDSDIRADLMYDTIKSIREMLLREAGRKVYRKDWN